MNTFKFLNQVLLFEGTRIEKLQEEINEVIRHNELTIQSTQITSIMNVYDVIRYTILLVVTN